MYIPMEMPKYTEELSIDQLGFASVPYLDGKPIGCSIDEDKVVARFECKDGTCFILILKPQKKKEIPRIEAPTQSNDKTRGASSNLSYESHLQQ